MLIWITRLMFKWTPLLLILASNVNAAQLDYSFKSPSFSGIGYSSHVQTLENTETSRKKAIDDKRLADAKEAAALAKNTNLQKFLNNFESRVYAQLSTQLVNNLFGENPQNSGTVEIEGNTIQYVKTTDMVSLTVTDPNGNITQVEIPIGQLKF
jgi:curli production assembly/transport component CsgF